MLLSRRLRDDLPLTLAALARGELTEDRAFALAREVAHLTPEQRGRVDADLDGRLVGLGDVQLRAGRAQVVPDPRRRRRDPPLRPRPRRPPGHHPRPGRRHRTGHRHRHPRDDGRRPRRARRAAAAARAAGDERTPGQVRADTLVARILGTQSDPASEPTAPAVRVNLVIGIESLFGESTEPGLIPGTGFLPAALCIDLVRRATAAAKATLRRLFVTPDDRALVAMESTSRRFDGLLAEFLDLRDGGHLPHPGLQRPDPAPRPHQPAADDGTHRRRQRPRALRTLQLPQGNPRLGTLGRPPRRHQPTRGPRSHRTPPHPQIHRTTHARRTHHHHRLLTSRAPCPSSFTLAS